MSHQVNNTLAEVDAAMRQLREAIKGIPVRREGFKKLHDTFARSVSTVAVNLRYSSGLLRR